MQAAPAGCAEPVIVGDGNAAAGATRRQCQSCDETDRPCAEPPARPCPDPHAGLSRSPAKGTSAGVSATDSPPDLFDRPARRRRRDRAAAGDYAAYAFLRDVMVEGLLERLSLVKRGFADVLDIGSPDAQIVVPGARIARADPGFGFARGVAGVQIDEDRLPFADGSFDAVLSAGVLDQVNDLPGALTLIRRALRPDGVFMGAFLGAGSVPALRAALRSAEGDRPAARLHPQIDVRSAGDLLVRAGFALPVADIETLDIGYPDLGRLLADLRGMAGTNVLTDRHPLSRAALAAAAQAFAAAAGPDGRVRERIDLIFLTAWSPDASQPQPARRGSGTSSLAQALRPPR